MMSASEQILAELVAIDWWCKDCGIALSESQVGQHLCDVCAAMWEAVSTSSWFISAQADEKNEKGY